MIFLLICLLIDHIPTQDAGVGFLDYPFPSLLSASTSPDVDSVLQIQRGEHMHLQASSRSLSFCPKVFLSFRPRKRCFCSIQVQVAASSPFRCGRLSPLFPSTVAVRLPPSDCSDLSSLNFPFPLNVSGLCFSIASKGLPQLLI